MKVEKIVVLNDGRVFRVSSATYCITPDESVEIFSLEEEITSSVYSRGVDCFGKRKGDK